MKIKPILCAILAVFITAFVSCSDDLNSIGGSIQPGGDDINLGVDTFYLTAETIMWDSIYARATNALIGEYSDPIFGRIKSDFLSEFFCPKYTWFEDRLIRFDSVYINLVTYGYTGDTISPVGLSAYVVNEKLDRNFYTNIDPADYCDLTKVLGRTVFSLKDLPVEAAYNGKPVKSFRIPLDTMLGWQIYDEWKDNPGTFANSDSFREFFPGVYVTNTFGSMALLNIGDISLTSTYSYFIRNHDDTQDSIVSSRFILNIAPEIIQMNHVENEGMDHLISGGMNKTYMKSPAGVYTELTIPLNAIADVVREDTIVNLANFKMTGYTAEEQYSEFDRPDQLLFINKDSIESFFAKKQLPDNKTSFIIYRTSSNNTYNFGNLSKMVNYYLDKYREDGYSTIPDLKYVLMPVDLQVQIITDYYGYTSQKIIGVNNKMAPSSAILHTEPAYMKMPLIYSKYNDRN